MFHEAKTTDNATTTGLLTPKPRPSTSISTPDLLSVELNNVGGFSFSTGINDITVNDGGFDMKDKNDTNIDMSNEQSKHSANVVDITINNEDNLQNVLFVEPEIMDATIDNELPLDITVNDDKNNITSDGNNAQDITIGFNLEQTPEKPSEYELERSPPLTRMIEKHSTPKFFETRRADSSTSDDISYDVNGFPVASFLKEMGDPGFPIPSAIRSRVDTTCGPSNGGLASLEEITPPARTFYNGSEPMRNLEELDLESIGLKPNLPNSLGQDNLSFKITGTFDNICEAKFNHLSVSIIDGGQACNEAIDKFIHNNSKAKNDAKYYRTRNSQLQMEVNQLMKSHGTNYEAIMETVCASVANLKKDILDNIEMHRNNGVISDNGVEKLGKLL